MSGAAPQRAPLAAGEAEGHTATTVTAEVVGVAGATGSRTASRGGEGEGGDLTRAATRSAGERRKIERLGGKPRVLFLLVFFWSSRL